VVGFKPSQDKIPNKEDIINLLSLMIEAKIDVINLMENPAIH
jgi:hypothetical protein